MDRTINISSATRMSEAVSENPFLLLLLEHLGIELPLQEKSVSEVASMNGIDRELFLTFIRLYGDLNCSVDNSFTGEEVPTILLYLRNSHGYYTDEVYPGIREIILGLNRAGNSKETAMIEKFFMQYLSEVKNHFEYEEKTVFPYILQLHATLSGKDLKEEFTGYSVAEYKDHHDDIEEKLYDLKSLLIEYLPMIEGKQMRRMLLLKLYELEHDIRIHSRIEDYLLIPLVDSMEARIKNMR